MEPAAINAGCFEPDAVPARRARVDARGKRRGADLRRGDHGVSALRRRRRAGALWHRGRPTVLGKARSGQVHADQRGLGSAATMALPPSKAASHKARDLQRTSFRSQPPTRAFAHLAQHADRSYPRMEGYARAIAEHVRDTARRNGVAVTANQAGPLRAALRRNACGTLHRRPSRTVDRERTSTFTGASSRVA